jgi:hypothetical protein
MPKKKGTPAKGTPAKGPPAKGTPAKNTPAKTPAKGGGNDARKSSGKKSAKKEVAGPSMEVSSPGKSTGGHDRTKWAGSATMGVAPAPEDLPLPKFLQRASAAAAAGPPQTPPLPQSGGMRRAGESKEMTVAAHDLVPFFQADALGTKTEMERLAINDGLQAVPTLLPKDASVSVREWTDDGYFTNTMVKQVNVRGGPPAVPPQARPQQPLAVPRNYDPDAPPPEVLAAAAVPRNYDPDAPPPAPAPDGVPRNYDSGSGGALPSALNAAGLAAAGW